MPRIYARGNFAGIDSRPGWDDASINNCSSCTNVHFRDKTIKPRKGHRKLHTTAVPTAGIIWNSDTAAGPMVIADAAAMRWATASDYTCEFAFHLDELPPTGSTRQLLDGSVGARVTASAVLELGWDTGAGVVYVSVGGGFGVAVDTTYFVSFTYTAASDEVDTYADGSFWSNHAAYSGGAGFNPQDVDVEVGSVLAGVEARDSLVMCELRFWNVLRTAGEIGAWFGKQLPPAYRDNVATPPFAYWTMDEGTGNVVADSMGGQDAYLHPARTWSLGIAPDRGAAITNTGHATAPEEGSVVCSTINSGAGPGTVTYDWNYFSNGRDQTWQFFLQMDAFDSSGAGGVFQPAILDIGRGNGTGMQLRAVYRNGDKARLGLYLFRASLPYFIIETPAIEFTGGKDIAVTCNYTTNAPDRVFAIWVDGAKIVESGVVTNIAGDTAAVANTVNLIDMNTLPPLMEGWSYTVDDIKVYNALRSAEQIAAVAGNVLDETAAAGDPLATADTTLVAYYRLNAGSYRETSLTVAPVDPGVGYVIGGSAHWAGSLAVYELAAVYGAQGGWGPGLVSPYDGDIRGQGYVDGALIVAGRSGIHKIDETNGVPLPMLPHAGSFPAFADAITFENRLCVYGAPEGPGVYENGRYSQLGIRRPTSAMTVDLTAGALGTWEVGDYIFAYTYYSSRTGIESDYSPTSIGTMIAGREPLFGLVSAGSNPVTAYTDNADVDTVIIYATKAFGTELFEVSRIDYGSSASVVSPGPQTTAIPITHQQPGPATYAVERDGRMISAGNPDASRGFFWSEVGFPEYQQPINFRALSQDVVGVANTDDNLLMVFGTDRRGLIRGDVTNLLEPFREFDNGGCLSHAALENVGGWIYGMGLDGPFMADDKVYRPIDEIVAGGRVVGSIRDFLANSTDKTQWDRSTSAYNFDKKTWYLGVPSSAVADDNAVMLTLHVDIMAWSHSSRVDRAWATLGRRVVSGTGEQVIGEAIPGFVCAIDDDDNYLDGRNTTSNDFTVVSTDAATQSIVLSAAPEAVGDNVLGCSLWTWNATDDYYLFLYGQVEAQIGTTVYLRSGVATINVNDVIRIGTYAPTFTTKALNSRTSVANSKIWDYLNVYCKQTAAPLNLKVNVQGADDAHSPIGANPADFELAMDESTDLRTPLGYAAEHLFLTFAVLDPAAWEIYSYVIDYRQQRNSH